MHERDIFLAALEIADPAERSAYIDQACGTNSTLRAQVEELLRTHAETSQFLETPAAVMDSEVAQTVITDSTAGDKTDADDDDPRSERATGEAEFRRFLQPATRPGWLGRLAHYEIEQILGRGAFGIVAKAFDEKLHRVVAIKLMNPELASTSPPRKRFLREARTAAAVTHENIVAIYAVEEEPIPYLVMEYVPGQTLQQRMDEHGPFEVADVLRIGQQVAAGMAAAHAMKLIHRDIKPANILLTGGINERAKISDFGLARAVDDATMTSSGLIAGTPMYMAPEQARGEVLDHRADLFSLGSVLYQMVSGRPPFRAANTVAVLKRVCEDTPRPLEDVIPGTPVWLSNIIFRLMEKDREERYQSAQEVADLFSRCLNELQLNGYVSIAGEASRLSETRRIEPLPAKTPQVSNQWRQRFFVAYVIGLTLLVVSAAVWVRIFRPQPAQSKIAEAAGSVSQPAQIPDKPTATTGWHGWPADAPKPAIAPFDAAQAKQHQAEWAAYLKVPVEYTNSIGMKFRLIPPGEYTRGSTPQFVDELHRQAGENFWGANWAAEIPQHRVRITQPYYLGKYEVTFGEFKSFVSDTQYKPAVERDGGAPVTTEPKHPDNIWSNKKFYPAGDASPVVLISLIDARTYCKWLSGRPGRIAYRPPTEAEWEYACRAGDEGVRPAKQMESNSFGISEMLHWKYPAISELCSDFSPAYTTDLTVDPAGDQTLTKASIRGYPMIVGSPRYSERLIYGPTYSAELGLRIVASVDDVRQALKSQTTPEVATTGWHGWPADAPKPAIAPFDAAQAKQHQEEWAAYLKVPVEYTNSIGMKFRLIPPGEFLMGSTDEEVQQGLKETGTNTVFEIWVKSEAPQHKVILTRPTYVSTYEVTQGQYELILGRNPSYFSPAGEGQAEMAGLSPQNFPVEMVSWNDAAEYCAKLSQRESLKPRYFRADENVTFLEGAGYQLPTEAVWEFACRGGAATPYGQVTQDGDLKTIAWFGPNAGKRTHQVGELAPNPFGLYDLQGNVWEWVQDGWKTDYYAQFQSKPAKDPLGPSPDTNEKVFRGGGWYAYQSCCRVSDRHFRSQSNRDRAIGFRVSLPVEAVQQALKSTGPAMQGELAAPPQSSPLQTPRTGPALAFTKTEDRVDVPAVPIDLSKPWTFEAWAEITDLRNVISQSVATLGPVRLKLYFDKAWEVELSQFIVGGPYTRGAALRDSAYVPGRVHVASQWTGTQLQLFVNGRPVTTSPHTFRTETAPVEIIRELLKPTQSVQLQIGNYAAERLWPGAGNSLGGNVDSLRISTGNMYAGPFVPGPLSKTADTIALYDFSQGNGGVLRDISGNGHDGKIIGATWVQSREGSNTVTGWYGWPADAPKPAIAPFDAAQAKKHQEEWAAYLKVPVEYENSIGMKFRLIPPGEFLMGSTPEEIAAALKDVVEDKHWQECIQSEAPQHKVILTQPIYLGVNEVTQTKYEQVMAVNPSHFAPMGAGKEAVTGLDTAKHPVEMVSWNDAAEFCAKLSQQEKLKPFYFRAGDTITPLDGTGYRLPSEAEWEFTCRAGTATKYWIGEKDEELVRAGWLGENSGGRTHAAGELKANPFGLFDMHGNVWEWVQDGWEASYYGQFQEKPATNPSGPFSAGSRRMIRGGGWGFTSSACRSSVRFAHDPTPRSNYIGFRVSLPVEAVQKALKAQTASSPAPAAAETLAEYYARNRRAAEKVLAVGGEQSNVTIEITQPFEWRTVSPGQTLPDVPFLVRSWSVKNAQVVTNDDLDVLAGLRHVLSLNLTAQGGLDAACVAKIASLQSPLNDLGIGHIQLKTSDLGQLPIMPHIHVLWISAEQVDDGWRFLKRFPALRKLMLYGAPVPDLRPLGEMSQLRRLEISAWGQAPDAVQIGEMQSENPQLRIFFRVDGKLTHLGTDPATAAGRKLLEAGIIVSELRANGRIIPLSIDTIETANPFTLDVKVIPRGVALTAELRGLLTHVDLQNLTAEGLQEADALAQVLRNRQDMEILNLMDSDLTDAGLLQLQRLAGMRSLNIRGTKVTAEGIAAFHRAVPGCHLQTDSGDIPVDYLAIPQPSVTESGLEFDGAQTYIEIPRLATRNDRPITVEAWLTPYTWKHSTIMYAAGRRPFSLYLYPNPELKQDVVGFWCLGNKIELPVSRNMVGERIHVAGVYDNEHFTVYLNGQPSAKMEPLVREGDDVLTSYIGAQHDWEQNFIPLRGFLHANLHSLRFSESVRYSGAFEPPDLLVPDADTKLCYQFTSGNGEIATDLSAHKFHGKIVGGKWIKVPGAGLKTK